MRKLYTLLLALAVALSSSAMVKPIIYKDSPLKEAAISNLEISRKAKVRTQLRKDERTADNTWKSQLGLSRADDWTVVGNGKMYDGLFTGEMFDVTIEESVANPGIYRIPDIWSQIIGAECPAFVVDATVPGVVTVPFQSTGIAIESAGLVNIFSVSYYYEELGGYSPEEFLEEEEAAELNITFEDGIIYFPETSLFASFGDTPLESLTEDDMIPTNEEMAIAFPGKEWIPEWSEAYETTMLDGCIDTFYLTGVEQTPKTVYIQKNNRTEGVYRLLDPLRDVCQAYEINYGGEPMYILTFPEENVVVVPLTETGLLSSDSAGNYYIVTYGNACGLFSESIEDFKASEDYVSNWTINETGLVSTPAAGALYWPFFSYETGEVVQILENEDEFAGWIQLPGYEPSGVNSITVDNSDAIPVYFNLQGVQLQQPKAGEVVIVKKGSNVKKTIIR